MSERLRIFLALLAAAALPGLLFGLPVFAAQLEHQEFLPALQTGGVIFLLAFGIAYAHALLLGLPLFLACKRRGLTGWRHSLAGGFLIGAIPSAILSLWLHATLSNDFIKLIGKDLNVFETIPYAVFSWWLGMVSNGRYSLRQRGVLLSHDDPMQRLWWLDAVLGQIGTGLLGAVCAYAAWLTWRHLPKQPP